MDCPQCGYVMDPFEEECPRCKRLGTKAGVAPPAGTRTQPPAEPALSSMPAPPPSASAPRPATLGTQATNVARDTVQSMRPEPLFNIDAPDIGWPLTILLWIVIIFNSLVVAVVILGAIGVQLFLNNDQATHAVGALMWLILLVPAVQLISAIAMLRCQRWGFYLYCLFVVGPVFLGLMLHGIPTNYLRLAIETIPAVGIFILVLSKWDMFE